MIQLAQTRSLRENARLENEPRPADSAEIASKTDNYVAGYMSKESSTKYPQSCNSPRPKLFINN